VTECNKIKVRKLTPREYGRLQDFEDEDINKIIATGMSNTQMYKQFGNSIVVSCLTAIIGTMLAEEIT